MRGSSPYSDTNGSPSARDTQILPRTFRHRTVVNIRRSEAGAQSEGEIPTCGLVIIDNAPVCELLYLGSILPTQARESTGKANGDTSLMDDARCTRRAAE